MEKKIQHIIGVDEAGRGPLAGPVAVGAVMVPATFEWAILPYVDDSKRVSPKRRELTYKKVVELTKVGVVSYHVALVSALRIDEVGVVEAIREGVNECFQMLRPKPQRVTVKLDGLLVAPEVFYSQETIIGGDRKELVIGLASILAKVVRDRVMVEASRLHPSYGFDVHKGYGTEAHWKALRRHGPSSLHRRTFLKNL